MDTFKVPKLTLMLKRPFPLMDVCLRAAIICWLSIILVHADTLKVSRPDGPVTRDEIDSFKAYMQTVEPESDNIINRWAQGRSGSMVQALGLMYEVTKDQAILDRMIYFCDAVLSERNDIANAPLGQHQDWLGDIPPAWPNRDTDTMEFGEGEQGDSIGHLGYCAQLILSTPSIWKNQVTIGDPHHYGATYLERAKTYVKQADDSLDKFVFPYLLDLSHDNHYWWSMQRPTSRPSAPRGGCVPWNQQMMFSYALQSLAQSHEILKDDPARVKKYDSIVGANMKWFFDTVTHYTSPKTGSACYNWAYALPATSGEDSNHGSLDVAGIVHAFASGRYGLKKEDLVPFANTVIDVMILGPKEYAGRVNGANGEKHAAETKYLRSGYLMLAAFTSTPDAYAALIDPSMASGATDDPLAFARFIWVKDYRRHQQQQDVPQKNVSQK